MPTEQKILNSSDESEVLSEQITELETLLQKSESLRKKQFFVSAGALILMLLILAAAILNLTNYFRNYPKKMLMQEVFFHARPLLYTPWNIRGNTSRERRILQHTVDELEKTLKDYMPQIRHALRQSVRSLKRYTSTELRREFRQNLYISLQLRAGTFLAEKKIHADEETLKQIREMNGILADALTREIFSGLAQAGSDSRICREEIGHLFRSGAMDRLKKEPAGILEERFLSSLMEILLDSPDEMHQSPKGKNREVYE